MKNFGYKSLAVDYDLFYQNKDYSKEVAFLSNYFRKNQIKTVLDVGCGTGTHMALLEKEGFHCTGVDLNKEMLEAARDKVKGDLHEADSFISSYKQRI
jgi:ubiquinone/menaquinone biosynthesis C-methylase UbiE